MFPLQFSTATYDPAMCLSDTNLINNLNLMPQVLDQLHFAQRGYTLNNFAGAFGAYSGDKVKVLANNNVSWAVQQRPFVPLVFRGYVSGSTASNGTLIALTQDEPFYGETYTTSGGYNIYVSDAATKTTTGWSVKFKSIQTVPTTEFATNKKAGITGTKYPKGSKQGYGRVAGIDWYSNYFTIARHSMRADNELLTSVTWVTNPEDGSKYWFYEYQRQLLEQHSWELEQQRWFGTKTTADSGLTWLTDSDGNDIVSGDGYIAQTQGANSDTYVPYQSNVSEKIKDRIVALREFGGGSLYQKIAVHTGDGYGSRVFHAAMQAEFQQGYKTLFYNAVAGKEIEVGEDYTTYSFGGNTVILRPNMLFIDPRIHVGTQIDGKDSVAFDMYFMPIYSGGSSNQNICVAYRTDAQGRGDRRFIVKYEGGMISPRPNDPIFAASGYDGHIEHYLTEHMLMVFNPEETASLIAAAA